jgi:hypothetical protein
MWAKHGGSIDVNDIYGDEGNGIDIDAQGNCYATGNFYTQATFGPFVLSCPTQHREIYVVKYDANGNELWARQPVTGIANNYSRAIAVDGSGNSYITGYLGGGTNDFGGHITNGPGAFVVKYDSSGNAVYATKLAAYGGVDAYGICVDNSGNVYVTGYLQGSDSVGGQLFTSSGMRDAFIIKVDAAGNFVWLQQSQSIPGTMTYGRGVAADVQGNVIMTGDFDNAIIFGPYTLSGAGNGTECFVAKFEAAGNILWAKQSLAAGMFGGSTQGFAIVTDSNSNVAITGVYRDSVHFSTQALPSNGTQTFIVKYDSSGNCDWAVPSTGQNPGAFGYGISTDNHDSYFITGFYKGPPIFGSDTLNVHGGEDILVAKIGNTVVQANFSAAVTSMCPGTCISFTNLSLQATSYQWSFPGANPSTSTDASPQNICYDSSGTFDVQLIASNGMTGDTLMLSNYITVYSSPSAPAITQISDTLFATQGYAGYQWYFDSVLVTGATNYFYVATQSGNFNVVVSDEHGCEVGAGIVNVIARLNPTLSEGEGVIVFPNPTEGEFSVYGLQFSDATLEIYNVLGEKVFFETLKSKQQTFNCKLEQGIYFVKVSDGENILTQKLIVE